MSYIRQFLRATVAGKFIPLPGMTCTATHCARIPGPLPTLRVYPSCPAWCAMTKSPAAKSPMRSALPCPRRATPIFGRLVIKRPTSPAPKYPPMGQRFRLKADFNITNFNPTVQVILRAMKKYGIILADNGSSWYISGAPDERWDNDVLHELAQVTGANFEAVDESSLMLDPNSGQVRATGNATPTPTLVPTLAPTARPTGDLSPKGYLPFIKR